MAMGYQAIEGKRSAEQPMDTPGATLRDTCDAPSSKKRESRKIEGVPLGYFMTVALGYGCYLALFPFGPVGTTLLVGVFPSEPFALAARAIAFVAIGLAMLAQRNLGASRMRSLAALNISYALVTCTALAMTIMPAVLGALGEAAVIMVLMTLSLVFGLALGMPELGWYEALHRAYELGGQQGAVLTVLAVAGVSILAIPFSGAMVTSPWVMQVVTLVLAAVSWACAVHARHVRDAHPVGEGPVMDSDAVSSSTLSRLITIVDGVVWGICCCMLVMAGFGKTDGGMAIAGAFTAGVAVCVVFAIFARTQPASIHLAFGMNLRLSLLAMGVAFALLPLLLPGAPFGVAFACYLVYQMQNVFNPYFITMLCGAGHLAVHRELPPSYATSTLGTLIGVALFVSMHALCEPALANGIVIACGTVLLFALAPALPARSSNIAEVTYNSRRGINSEESRREHAVEVLTEGYSLTAREADVLRLILEHKSREEMAESLCVSPSTVKNHTTRLYAKLGVHSAREVEAMLRDGGLL